MLHIFALHYNSIYFVLNRCGSSLSSDWYQDSYAWVKSLYDHSPPSHSNKLVLLFQVLLFAQLSAAAVGVLHKAKLKSSLLNL